MVGIWYLKHTSPKINYLYVWFPPIHDMLKKTHPAPSLVITTNQKSTNLSYHLGTCLPKESPTPFVKKTSTLGCQMWDLISPPTSPTHFSLLHIGALGQPQVPWFLPGWVKNVDHFAAIVLTPRWRHHVWQLQGPFLLGLLRSEV